MSLLLSFNIWNTLTKKVEEGKEKERRGAVWLCTLMEKNTRLRVLQQ